MSITAAERTARRIPVTMAGAVHSNCDCLRCRIGYSEWLRERRAAVAAGTWEPFVDATPAREHIEKLYKAGVSLPVIATLAKLHLEDIRRVRGWVGNRPGAERIRPDTARAILSAELHFSHLPAKALIPSRGSARRIQSLRAIGWPSKNLGPRIGLSQKGMSELLVQHQTQVSTHLAVAAAYEDLYDQDPIDNGIDPVIARRTRRQAKARGWAVPAAWTDIDTDDAPDRAIRGFRFQKPLPRARQDAVVAETEYLARAGFTRDEITTRLGVGWDAVKAAHKRAAVELPARLVQDRAVDEAA